MNKKILAILLTILLAFSFTACSGTAKEEKLIDVNLTRLKRQDLGNMMPKVLFSDGKKVVFWGSIGLFVVNGEDGSIYRAVNLEKIGYNHITGDPLTVVDYSPNFEKIYFRNVDVNDENVDNFYYCYDIEEDMVRQYPNDHEVEILDIPAFTLDDLGGGETTTGYSSNPVFYDDEIGVYLHSENWEVKDLEMVFYNHQTEEFRHVPITWKFSEPNPSK